MQFNGVAGMFQFPRLFYIAGAVDKEVLNSEKLLMPTYFSTITV